MTYDGSVGVLTFSRTLNYGANLQSIALFSIIENLGFDTIEIDLKNRAIELREMPVVNKETGKDLLKSLITYPLRKQKLKTIGKDMRGNILFSDSIEPAAFASFAKSFDFIVSGSDQIWNLNLTGNSYEYMLEGLEGNAKKIAYAASAGSGLPLLRENQKALDLIRGYAAVSVREASLKKELETAGIEAEVVLDPSLLLTPEQWNTLQESSAIKSDYVFAYAVGDAQTTLSAGTRKAESLRLPLVMIVASPIDYLKLLPKFRSPNRLLYSVSLSEFLTFIRNATHVVTSSFHGLCFSLLYKRSLSIVTGTSKYANERLVDLVGRLQLDLVNKDISEYVLEQEKPYCATTEKLLQEQREQSLRWLKSTLSG